MWCGQLLLLTLGGLFVRVRGQARLLELSGACPFHNFLNGLLFELKGTTRNGAPWYKAQTQAYYIYYDEACGGSLDGTPRWIIDNDKPSETRAQDLDADGDCFYHGSVDSSSKAQPPGVADWKMMCGSSWQDVSLQLQEVQPGVSPGTGTTTLTTTTKHRVPNELRVQGACAYKNWLNGMVFVKEGETASGSPYYKSAAAGYYIYYDPDCSGVAQGFSRWIIDSDKPSLTKTEDLDNDGDCVYQARVEVNPSQSGQPPASALWKMNCGQTQLEEHLLTLEEITTTSTTTVTTVTQTTVITSTNQPTAQTPLPSTSLASQDGGLNETSSASPTTVQETTSTAPPVTSTTVQSGAAATSTNLMSSTTDGAAATSEAPTTTTAETLGSTSTMDPPPAFLQLSGACSELSAMNNLAFQLMGSTAAGAPYYRAMDGTGYIYHDPSCSGNTGGSARAPRWVIDDEAPRLDASMDLDGDGDCFYLARQMSEDSSKPPSSASWRMRCGSAWQTVQLALQPLANPPMTTQHVGHVPGTSSTPGQALISATGPRAVGAASLLLGAVALLCTGW